ncbi:hypothetical protein [Rossellomorea marisflavi]|uniref:hypothetical protein n=1 Tax=Rossellomorea marisflavi TaxID=189381 RepID=UPI003D2F453B
MRIGMANNQVIEISLGGIEVFSIIASVFSIVLGIVAIWLSVVFYKMSEKSSKEIEKSSNAIGSNVEKLDVLFNKMYSDTFGMVKDTVSDMRQHVYKDSVTTGSEMVSSEIENKTKSIVDAALKELQEDRLSKEDVEGLVNGIIKESTQIVENYEKNSTIKQIKNILKENGPLTYSQLEKRVLNEMSSINLFDALEEMVEQNIIHDPFDFNEEEEKIIFLSANILLK